MYVHTLVSYLIYVHTLIFTTHYVQYYAWYADMPARPKLRRPMKMYSEGGGEGGGVTYYHA